LPSLAALACWISLPVSFKSSPDARVAAAQAHDCPPCQERVSWLYGHWPDGPKGIPTDKKVVTHQGSGCKQAWSSAIAEGSTCPACAQQVAMCPACQAQSR